MRALAALALVSSLGCMQGARAPTTSADPLEPLPWGKHGCAAVLSYRVPAGHPLERELGNRSFVYDNALAMLVHLNEGRPERARAIGCALVALRNPDRTIGFSFDFGDPPDVDARYVRAGVVAWTAYALATYDLRTGTATFRDAARSLADGLLATRFADGAYAGLIAAGRGRYVGRSFEPQYVADYAVTEHQIDAYFMLRALAELDPSGPYAAAAAALARDTIRAAWLDDEDVLAAGVDRDGPTDDRALDAAGAWGTLFLLATGDLPRARRSLRATHLGFARVIGGVPGYAPYVGAVSDYPDRDLSQTFFTEGTAAMGVSFARLHRVDEANRIASTLRRLRTARGNALPYAFPDSPDFPELPAVAPTAWLRLLERELESSSPFVFAPRASP